MSTPPIWSEPDQEPAAFAGRGAEIWLEAGEMHDHFPSTGRPYRHQHLNGTKRHAHPRDVDAARPAGNCHELARTGEGEMIICNAMLSSTGACPRADRHA